jgi:23S rRNA pseudouridine2605 synthase
MHQRLNKYLATNLGISRREADDLISAGQVAIDGQPVILGTRIEEGRAATVKGTPVKAKAATYLMLNKPPGYVSSRRRQGMTPTLYELLPEEYQKLKTVGRLDKDSSGLILLTSDGDFAFAMTHPKFRKNKTYHVSLESSLAPLHQQMIADFGIHLTDGSSKLTLTPLGQSRRNWQVELSEGRNRQIRRTFGALGLTVKKLHRVSFGPYSLDGLASGKWKILSAKESC